MKQVIAILVTITIATCDKLNKYLPPRPDAFAIASANNYFPTKFSNHQPTNSFQQDYGSNIDQYSPLGSSAIQGRGYGPLGKFDANTDLKQQNGNFQREGFGSFNQQSSQGQYATSGDLNKPKEEQVKFTSSRFSNNVQKQSPFGGNDKGFIGSKINQYLPPWNGFGGKSQEQYLGKSKNGFTNQQSDFFGNRQASVSPFRQPSAEKKDEKPSFGNFNQKPYGVFGNSNRQFSNDNGVTNSSPESSPTTSSLTFNHNKFDSQTRSKFGSLNQQPFNGVSTGFQAQQKNSVSPKFGADSQIYNGSNGNGRVSASSNQHQETYPQLQDSAKEAEDTRPEFPPNGGQQYDNQGGYKY